MIKNKRLLKIALATFGTALVLVLVLAPGLVKNYINKHGEELARRNLHVDKLRYNYFTSTLRVINFSMFEKNDTNEFVGFDTLIVNFKPLRLLKNEFYLQQFLLVNPRGVILQNDTVFNFSDYLWEDTSSNVEVDDSTQLPYQFNLNQLEVSNGNFTYTDQLLNHSIHLNSISFKIPQIFWNATDSSKAGLDFDLANGGHFAANMDYVVETGDFHGRMEVTDLQLKTFLPYLQQYLKFADVEGAMDGKITFKGSSEEVDEFSFQGEASMNNVTVKDHTQRKVLGVKKYLVEFKNVEPLKGFYELERMEMDSPYVYLALEDSLFNFEKMMVEFDSIDVDQADSTGTEEMFVKINHASIQNGLIDFSDQRFNSQFNYELSEVKLDVDTLELEDNWVNLTGTMKLNKRGTLEAQLGLNPTNYLDSMQLNYVITDFQLPDLNIYSKHYMGLPILFGDMYYISKTSLVHRQLTSENELIIRNVDMGRKSGGLYDVPVKLALYVLKDINGDIKLDIPVRGDFDDPKTRIGPIVFNTLKNLIFKIVASPFKALGNILGAQPDEISQIIFDYSDTTLTKDQIKSLNLLLKLEELKPELQTDLLYFNDTELEKLDAAREISHQLYYAKTNKNADTNLKNYLKFLATQTKKDSLVMQDYEVLLAPEAQVDSILKWREEKRFAMVRQYISTQNDFSRIRLVTLKPGEVLNKGSRPHFEVKVNLAEDME